jgi:methionine aminopeptidase
LAHEHHTEDPEDIERMRVAGRFASDVLDYITPHIKPGITTQQIDDLCANAWPSKAPRPPAWATSRRA